MSSTNFVDQQTVVVASWLNDVNTTVYDVLGDGTNPPANISEVKTNLGLGTAADKNTSYFATAAQGAKADSAVQPAAIANMLETTDIGVTVQGYDVDTAKTNVAQSWSGSQRGTQVTDNDLSFNMNAANNFICTPTGTGALTFTNITAGQSGYILLINTGGHAITAAATTKVGASMLSTVSASGTYLISYLANGTNVYCTASGALA